MIRMDKHRATRWPLNFAWTIYAMQHTRPVCLSFIEWMYILPAVSSLPSGPMGTEVDFGPQQRQQNQIGATVSCTRLTAVGSIVHCPFNMAVVILCSQSIVLKPFPNFPLDNLDNIIYKIHTKCLLRKTIRFSWFCLLTDGVQPIRTNAVSAVDRAVRVCLICICWYFMEQFQLTNVHIGMWHLWADNVTCYKDFITFGEGVSKIVI